MVLTFSQGFHITPEYVFSVFFFFFLQLLKAGFH